MKMDPIHQFEIHNLFKIGQIGDHAIYFTNSSAYMLVSVAVIFLLAVGGLRVRPETSCRIAELSEHEAD